MTPSQRRHNPQVVNPALYCLCWFLFSLWEMRAWRPVEVCCSHHSLKAHDGASVIEMMGQLRCWSVTVQGFPQVHCLLSLSGVSVPVLDRWCTAGGGYSKTHYMFCVRQEASSWRERRTRPLNRTQRVRVGRQDVRVMVSVHCWSMLDSCLSRMQRRWWTVKQDP